MRTPFLPGVRKSDSLFQKAVNGTGFPESSKRIRKGGFPATAQSDALSDIRAGMKRMSFAGYAVAAIPAQNCLIIAFDNCPGSEFAFHITQIGIFIFELDLPAEGAAAEDFALSFLETTVRPLSLIL